MMATQLLKKPKEVPSDTDFFNEFAPVCVATLPVKMEKSNAI